MAFVGQAHADQIRVLPFQHLADVRVRPDAELPGPRLGALRRASGHRAELHIRPLAEDAGVLPPPPACADQGDFERINHSSSSE